MVAPAGGGTAGQPLEEGGEPAALAGRCRFFLNRVTDDDHSAGDHVVDRAPAFAVDHHDERGQDVQNAQEAHVAVDQLQNAAHGFLPGAHPPSGSGVNDMGADGHVPQGAAPGEIENAVHAVGHDVGHVIGINGVHVHVKAGVEAEGVADEMPHAHVRPAEQEENRPQHEQHEAAGDTAVDRGKSALPYRKGAKPRGTSGQG